MHKIGLNKAAKIGLNKCLMVDHTLVHESSARDTMDSATKKYALTKLAPDST